MKMESIRDTKPTVIYALKQGVPVYPAAQYRDRIEIHNDLSSGKLELTLKDVEESDAGIYKCQAANPEDHGEKMIQLYVEPSAHTVTCQEHERAVLPFHFPFISGAEDLHVSWMKMELIRDTEPTVIYAIDNGAEEYHAAQYRNRTKIRTDLPSGKLTLILKHVKKSDAGIYKCQAANKKIHEEKKIKLSVEIKPSEIMKSEGESVTFRADFSGPRTEIVWKIGEDKLVEVEENYSHYYCLADRASASFHSGSLTIRHLVESDSGHYSRNILTEGKYNETKFILKVSPSKPEMYYEVTKGTITLYCESTSTEVTYEWRNSSGDLLSTEAIYTAPPETLRIGDTVTCIVTNKVSESSSSVTIHHLPEEEMIDTRNPEILPIVIGVISGITLAALTVGITLFIITKYRKLFMIYCCKSQEYSEKYQSRSVKHIY